MQNSFFDDMAKLFSGGGAVAQSVKEETEAMFAGFFEKFAQSAGFAKADELDACRETIKILTEKVEKLETEVATLKGEEK